MGRLQDQITVATMTAQSSNFAGSVLDLSGYTSGAFYINTTVAGTTFLPVFQMTLDGTNFLTIPSSILATPAAVTAVGLTAYPFLVPIGIGKFKFTATTFTGAFTASVVGIFNHN
jgi:hypothetical protein